MDLKELHTFITTGSTPTKSTLTFVGTGTGATVITSRSANSWGEGEGCVQSLISETVKLMQMMKVVLRSWQRSPLQPGGHWHVLDPVHVPPLLHVGLQTAGGGGGGEEERR